MSLDPIIGLRAFTMKSDTFEEPTVRFGQTAGGSNVDSRAVEI